MMRILNSVPWGCVNVDDQYAPGHDLSVWDDFIAGQLSELDSALQDVQKITAASVKPEKLNAANDLVHTCERNLRLATIYWDRSSQALDAAVLAIASVERVEHDTDVGLAQRAGASGDRTSSEQGVCDAETAVGDCRRHCR